MILPNKFRRVRSKYAKDLNVLIVPKWGAINTLRNYAPRRRGDLTTSISGAAASKRVFTNNPDIGTLYPNSGNVEWVFEQSGLDTPIGKKGLTFLCWATRYLMIHYQTANGTHDYRLLCDGTENLEWRYATGQWTEALWEANNFFPSNGNEALIYGVSARENEKPILYKHGSRIAWDTDPAAPSDSSEASNKLWISSQNYTSVGLVLFALLNRAIPESELKTLTINPELLFDTRPLPIWIPAAAAGGTDVTSTLATLSITPLASSINDKTQVTSSLATLDITALQSNVNDKTEIVSGTFGSLSITAYQSSINDKTQVTSTLADLPITPYQSTVSQGANVTSTLATLSITGYQSSINDKTQITSSLANLPLTGYTSIVAQSGDQSITSTLGQLTITTYTSTVNDKTQVTSSLGSLNLQSFASLVNDKTQVTSTLATLTITPYQSTITTAANIVSTLATLPITVFQSKVGQPTDITSTLAALSITPYASTIVDVTKIITGNTPHLPISPRQSIVAGEGAGGAAARSINSSWRRRRSH